MTTTTEPTIDTQATEAFAGRLLELFTGGMLTHLIDIGRRTGLFTALAGAGPVTSAALAAAAGLRERYVREWLGAMATGGIVEYNPSTSAYWLPAEHAVCLTGAGVDNLAPLGSLASVLGAQVPAVATAFRAGGGVPYQAYLPDLHDLLEDLFGPIYDELLVTATVPLVPGLPERLAAGARVADVACGTGRALLALATAFPASVFVGYDLDQEAIARAQAAAAARGLSHLTFEVQDAAQLATAEPFDAVFVFNALHDQAEPAAVLARIRAALVPGGVFVMDEPALPGELADNLDHPMAPFTYAISTLHCLPVSLAQDGAGLGTAWGRKAALAMLAEAGFGAVAVHDTPGNPGNAVFVTRQPG